MDAPICPFCGESFEGEEFCPVHDLELMSRAELEARARAAHSPLSLRYGRGALLAAAALGLLAFFLPFFVDAEGLLPAQSAFTIALSGGESLWLGFFAPMAMIGTLLTRRDLPSLRGVRLALAFVAFLQLLALALAAYRGLALASSGHSTVAPGIGLYLSIGAAAIACAASMRLGRDRREPPRLRMSDEENEEA